jgi:hypothetical protein
VKTIELAPAEIVDIAFHGVESKVFNPEIDAAAEGYFVSEELYLPILDGIANPRSLALACQIVQSLFHVK